MWAGPMTARGQIPKPGRVLGSSGSRRPRDVPGPLNVASTTGTTLPLGKSSRPPSFPPEEPGPKPRPLTPDPPGPPEPVHPLVGSSSSRSSKSSLGFISTPLIWPGRKRPSRGRPPSTTRVPSRQDNITKPSAKPNGTPAPNQRPAVLSETPKPTEDRSVSGQGSGEAEPLPLSEVSNRKNKLAQPKWFQTVVVQFLPLTVDNTSTFSYEFKATVPEEATIPGTIGSEVLPLDPFDVLPQNLETFVESLSSFDITGDDVTSLPVSMTGNVSTPDLVGITTATASAGDTSLLLSDLPEASTEDVPSTPTLSDHPDWDPPSKSVGLHTGDSQPPTGDPWPPTGDPQPPTGDPSPPTGHPRPPTGDPRPPTGDPQPPTGGPRPPTGDPSPPTGDPRPPTGDPLPPTGDPRPPTGDPRPTGDPSPPTSDPRPPTGDPRPPTSDLQPPTSDPKPPTGDPQPPTSDLQPPTGVHRSELPLPDQVVQTHPPPLSPSTVPYSLIVSSPPLSSFITSSIQLTRHHKTLPDQTSGLDSGSGFPSSFLSHDAFVFKLLPPPESAKSTADPEEFKNTLESNRTAWTTLKDWNTAPNTTKSPFPAAPVKPVAEGVVRDTAPPVSGSGTAKHSPNCPCRQRSQCPCGLSPGNST